MPAHNGALARLRAYAPTVEDFGAKEAALAIGSDERRAFNQIRQMIDAGQLFACGVIGHHHRRYTVHKHIADRIDAECAPKPLTPQAWRKKLGACLGGLTDIDSLMLRVNVDPDSECWVWQGATSNAAGKVIPVASINGVTRSVIRWVWETTHPEKTLEPGWIVWRFMCRNDRCCNPKHITAGSRAKWGEWVKRTKAWQGKASYRAANKAAGKRRTVLTDEVIGEVREGHVSADAMAQRLGVHVSSVHRALRRTQLVANASVFNFRPNERAA